MTQKGETSGCLEKALVLIVAEFDHLTELKETLHALKNECDANSTFLELTRVLAVLKYFIEAESRAAHFEKEAKLSLDHVYEDLSLHAGMDFSTNKSIILEVRKALDELKIARVDFINFISNYQDALKKSLSEVDAEIHLHATWRNEGESRNIHAKLVQIIALFRNLERDVEAWLQVMFAALQKAKRRVPEIYERQLVFVVCNAGKERSRMLAGALSSFLHNTLQVSARGSYGLKEQTSKGVATKYGWVPPEGFLRLIRTVGIDLGEYPSKLIGNSEVEDALIILTVSDIVDNRVRTAFPKLSSKVKLVTSYVSAQVGTATYPFPEYCYPNIPDAWGGYLDPVVQGIITCKNDETRELLIKKGSIWKRKYTDDEELFLRDRNSEQIDQVDVMKIPRGLRTYLGWQVDTDEAYLAEADFMKHLSAEVIKQMKRDGLVK